MRIKHRRERKIVLPNVMGKENIQEDIIIIIIIIIIIPIRY